MKKSSEDMVPIVKLSFKARHKVFYRFFMFVLILGLIIAGFQLYNYAKFVLGFDLTLRLSVDKHDIALVNGETTELEFTLDRISNIFCDTSCYYRFTDLSKNINLAEESFTMLQIINKNIYQSISAPAQGEGQVIYAFDITCKNNPTLLCKSGGANISRRTIITMEYTLSPEQLTLKESIKEQLYSAQTLSNQINNKIKKTVPIILQNYPYLINQENYLLLTRTSNDLSIFLERNLPLWIKQEYLNMNVNNLKSNIDQFKTNLQIFNKNLDSNILAYNLMITDISNIAQSLENSKNLTLDKNQSEKLENKILDFNQKVSSFDKKNNLEDKKLIFDSINSISLSDLEVQNITSGYNFSKTNLLGLTTIKVDTGDNLVDSNTTLPENKKVCCLNNICQSCEIQKKYPIILLHGHNFNNDISADNILNGFGELQGQLESLGYLNAGELYLYEPTRTNPGILGNVIMPIVVRPSYYFDFLKKAEGYKSIEIDSQNIDTYAIRLRDIINNIKYETSSPKVIIIAHSMGGLVLRRYIQIFGKENLDKIILIDTPNSGISGAISKSCPIFGAVSECSDMSSESLFINKLNTEDYSLPKTYNIVGIGCPMNEGDGDGVVLAESSILKENANVKNFFINGTCSGVSFLHNNILNINQYPEVFGIIEEALNN